MKKFYLDLGITAYHFIQERMREQIGFNGYEFKKVDLVRFLNSFCDYLRSKNYEVYIKTDKPDTKSIESKDVVSTILSLYTEIDIKETSLGIDRKGVEYYYYFNKDSLEKLSKEYEKVDEDYFKLICDYEQDRTKKEYESKSRNKFFKELYEMYLENNKSDKKDEEEAEDEKFENDKIALA